MNQRIIGIDLALKHNHRASIWDTATTCFLNKSFRVDRSDEGFDYLLKRSQQQADAETQFVFVMEPTSMAWLPLSCYLLAQGYTVYLIKPQMVSALRKFFNLNKSDRLDSETLAKVYLIKPESLHSLHLPTATINALNRFCRQRARLVKLTSAIKTRLWHIFTFVNPKALEAFKQDKFSQLGRAFLRHYISPYQIVELGVEGLTEFLQANCHGKLEVDIAQKLYQASLSTVRIYQQYKESYGLPFDLDFIQFEVNMELDILEMIEQKITILDKQIQQLYIQLDPDKQLQTIKGFSDVLAPIVLAVVGDIRRFPNVRSFKGFLRFHSKKKQTTDHDKKGLRIVKSSLWLLKQTFYMAAEVARHWDVELAEFYHRLLDRGLHHNQAICAVANKLAVRVYAVMKRMADNDCNPLAIAYQLRDLAGNPIDKRTAKQIIDKNYPGKYERDRRQRTQIKQQQLIKKQTKEMSSKLVQPTQKQFLIENITERTNDIQSLKEILEKLMNQYAELSESVL